jgi:hypothetical protein
VVVDNLFSSCWHAKYESAGPGIATPGWRGWRILRVRIVDSFVALLGFLLIVRWMDGLAITVGRVNNRALTSQKLRR